MDIKTKDIQQLVEKQNNWRGKECLNLIASENVQSPLVKSIEVNDFMGRYAEGHPNTNDEDRRYYEGTRWIDEIERAAEEEFIELAQCQQADVRPISGNAANTALALGILRGGDSAIVNSIEQGGHISHNPIGVVGRRIQKRGQALNLGKDNSIGLHFWPSTDDGYHLDAKACVELLDEKRPNLAILGKSLFLFPEPVQEIAKACRSLKIPLLYDGAHVLGLILGGCFQNPFQEGAHFINASTHKTFPGPQRGVILGNLKGDEEMKWWTSIDRGVMPGSSSSHHLHTLPGLVVTIREMKAYGKAYAKQTIENAKALGQALEDAGVDVEAKEFGFTESHQLAVRVSRFGEAKKIARHLAEQNIICNYNQLPGDPDARYPSGLRLGVQEMTRMGMKQNEMKRIAQLMSKAIQGERVIGEVLKLRKDFTEVGYC